MDRDSLKSKTTELIDPDALIDEIRKALDLHYDYPPIALIRIALAR